MSCDCLSCRFTDKRWREVDLRFREKFKHLKKNGFSDYNAHVGGFAEAVFGTYFREMKDVSAISRTHDFELGASTFDVKGSMRDGCSFEMPPTLPLRSDFYVFIKVRHGDPNGYDE